MKKLIALLLLVLAGCKTAEVTIKTPEGTYAFDVNQDGLAMMVISNGVVVIDYELLP